jgi:hypothetical protein
MTDDAPLTKSPVDTVLSPDGFPALALCNEAACVQFDPLALLYLQYCFWCQYNLFYAKEPLTATTSAIVAQIDAQYQAVIDFDAQMNKWRAEMADFEGSMVPANIPAEEPLPTTSLPAPSLLAPPPWVTVMLKAKMRKSLRLRQISVLLVPPQVRLLTVLPPNPLPPSPSSLHSPPSLFSSIIPLVPIPDPKRAVVMKDCPHVRDFKVAYTGETSSATILDPNLMYENVTQLYANHYKSNPFNTQSSYDNIIMRAHLGWDRWLGRKLERKTKMMQLPKCETTSSLDHHQLSPVCFDDYLQSEYQSFLHTIIQTLAATHVHTMQLVLNQFFRSSWTNFNIAFQISAEPNDKKSKKQPISHLPVPLSPRRTQLYRLC